MEVRVARDEVENGGVVEFEILVKERHCGQLLSPGARERQVSLTRRVAVLTFSAVRAEANITVPEHSKLSSSLSTVYHRWELLISELEVRIAYYFFDQRTRGFMLRCARTTPSFYYSYLSLQDLSGVVPFPTFRLTEISATHSHQRKKRILQNTTATYVAIKSCSSPSPIPSHPNLVAPFS